MFFSYFRIPRPNFGFLGSSTATPSLARRGRTSLLSPSGHGPPDLLTVRSSLVWSRYHRLSERCLILPGVIILHSIPCSTARTAFGVIFTTTLHAFIVHISPNTFIVTRPVFLLCRAVLVPRARCPSDLDQTAHPRPCFHGAIGFNSSLLPRPRQIRFTQIYTLHRVKK